MPEESTQPQTRSIWMALFHWPVSVVMMIFFSIAEGLLSLVSKETTIPGLPLVRQGDGKVPIAQVQCTDLTSETLRGFVRNSEPVIVKGVPEELFGVLDGFSPTLPDEAPKDKLLIDQFSFPRLGPLAAWIKAHVGKRVAYMARFSGGYEGGIAHIDSFPSYNFYYVKRGRKRVFIIPRQYNPQLDLAGGYDSVYVRADTANLSQMEWLDDVPAYYDFELSAGDVLLFNNSACVHKFMNLTETPEIFTIRLFSFDSSPLILRNDVLNWEGAKFFASVLLGPTTVRDTYSI